MRCLVFPVRENSPERGRAIHSRVGRITRSESSPRSLSFLLGKKGPRVRAGVAADTVEPRKRRSSQALRRRSCSPRWRPKMARSQDTASARILAAPESCRDGRQWSSQLPVPPNLEDQEIGAPGQVTANPVAV